MFPFSRNSLLRAANLKCFTNLNKDNCPYQSREIHVNDPEFYDGTYTGYSRRRKKDPKWTTVASAPLSTVSTVNNIHHPVRTSILKNLFSKQSIVQLEAYFKGKLKCCEETRGIL
ncbi:hypothetical protein K469DRAFT_139014 [Zopfia rhizophila CBS 207.26]|uniref:Uncharacterized protein n=1 Tax=Zopfia rhizophila CBS 207.26 TaxID=1314779 RepID=A0A6A6E646_9PEZI|nr:hypothetical protein K469DRAFT_139014 [Zopfia rhizophila CBS 207.26]